MCLGILRLLIFCSKRMLFYFVKNMFTDIFCIMIPGFNKSNTINTIFGGILVHLNKPALLYMGEITQINNNSFFAFFVFFYVVCVHDMSFDREIDRSYYITYERSIILN